ncbi:MAG: biopolymer transporter ExbD [Planctomycetota bacterium]
MEFRRRKRGRSALELTPLIDVVFQLLVFFLLTASFVQPSLRLDLPSGEASDEPDSKPIMVEIDAAGTLRVDGDVVPRDGLEDALRAALEDDRTAVRLSGDREMAYGMFVEALDAARRAGAAHFDLVHDGGLSQGGGQ